MSHEDAKILYQASHEAQQKFEYFLTGSIGAMFAYTVQTYTPKKLGLLPSTLEPIAIICFAAAFFFGLLRLGYVHRILGIRSHQAAAKGDVKRIESEFLEIAPYRDQLSSEEESNIQSWDGVLTRCKSRSESAKPLLADLDLNVRSYYVWRLRLMFVGFSLFVVARVLTPYFEPSTPQKPQTQAQAAAQPDQTKKSDPTPPK
jgi:hypothetical protein